jgi:hypothetical protein
MVRHGGAANPFDARALFRTASPMAKSRGRKQKKRPPATIQQRHHDESTTGKLHKNRFSTIGSILAAIVTFGGVVGLIWLIYDTYEHTFPEIHLFATDSHWPFLLPFTVKNNSSIFAMHDIQWYCYIDKIDFAAGGGIYYIMLSDSTKTTIGPEKAVNYRCLLAGVESKWLKSGRLLVYVKYFTLGFIRTSDSVPFTWLPQADPPRWIEGEIPQLRLTPPAASSH